MKYIDGKITEATESELRANWLNSGLCELYPFPDYLQAMKYSGVRIVDGTYKEENMLD